MADFEYKHGMRLLETLIPPLLFVYLGWPLTGRPRPLLLRLAPFSALVLLLTHLLLEGGRWQMIPLYALTGLSVLGSLIPFFRAGRPTLRASGLWPVLASILNLVLLAAATAVPILLPVPNVAAPGGPYRVGTRMYTLTDDSRRELYSGQDEARRFMLQVWYPAVPASDDSLAPWMSDAPVIARGISNYLSLPPFFLDHLVLVHTPAYQGARIKPSQQGYPVVLFSHGWNGFAAQNTGQALELASRGFVVAAVQHTYGAVVTVFPDGQVAANNPQALPSGAPDAEYEQAARLLAAQWAGDLAFALDFLTEETGDSQSGLYESLDTEYVGAYGHSTGGGAAIQFCGTDPRCDALLGMDPFLRPVSETLLEQGLPQPSLFLFSQEWYDDSGSRNNRLFDRFYRQLDPSTLAIGIQGTRHYDFSDLPMLSPIAAQLGLKGPIDGERVTEIVNAYLVEFFASALKGERNDLLSGPPPFPEAVELE